MHVVAVLALAVCSICGTWQSLFHAPTGPVRRVMEITRREPSGELAVTIHSIDETDVPIVAKTVAVSGSSVKMTFDMNTEPWFDYRRSYAATVSSDGSTMTGLWIAPGIKPIPTTYTKVVRATWPVVEPKTHMVTVRTGSQGRSSRLGWLRAAGIAAGRPRERRSRVFLDRSRSYEAPSRLCDEPPGLRSIERAGADQGKLLGGPAWRRRHRGDGSTSDTQAGAHRALDRR